jgi:hypothetical protein
VIDASTGLPATHYGPKRRTFSAKSGAVRAPGALRVRRCIH